MVRKTDGYSDEDVTYAAAQFCGEQVCLELLYAGGSEADGIWCGFFVFSLSDGQYGAVHGEEPVSRVNERGEPASNWTSFVHPSLAYIKEDYLPNHGKTLVKASLDTGKEQSLSVDAVKVVEVQGKMFAGEVIPVAADVVEDLPL